MTLEAQALCTFCGARHLFITGPERSPGDRTRSSCFDCGWLTLQVVTAVYDPDLRELADPYGPGIEIEARCIDCGHQYFSGTIERCYECGSGRFHYSVERWTPPSQRGGGCGEVIAGP